MTEVMWRCTKCGTWSHAKRMPRYHQRFVQDAPDDESLIIDYDHDEYDHMNGQTREGGYWIKCGPFERWLAVKA